MRMVSAYVYGLIAFMKDISGPLSALVNSFAKASNKRVVKYPKFMANALDSIIYYAF